MGLQCPACSGDVRGEAVDIHKDMAECPACGEVFRPSDALPKTEATPAEALGPPPSPEVVFFEQTPDGGLNMLLPKRGCAGMAIGAFAFGLFWNVIVIAVAGGFIHGMIQGEVPWLLIFFFVPFVIVGVLMPLWGCWLAWGTTAVKMDTSGVTVLRQLFGYTRTNTFALDALEPFAQEVAYTQNYQPVHAVTLRAGGKKIRFGHHLSGADQEWLVHHLNAVRNELRGS